MSVRTWLASRRCYPRRLRSGLGHATRNLWTDELDEIETMDDSELKSMPQKLRTPQDWARFRARREEQKILMKAFDGCGSTQTEESKFRLRDVLHKPSSQTTLSALVAAGAHFGHATSRMNPNFMPYAYGSRAGITIIDLDRTLPLLRRAANIVRSVAHRGGQIVFVGTRPDLQKIVSMAAERLSPQGYHVGQRWLPGTLTNKDQMFSEEVHSTKATPDLMVFLNPIQNKHAIHECILERIPTVAIVDSNVDPRIVMYPIPANDEAPRTAEIIAGVLSVAGQEGIAMREKAKQQAAAAAEQMETRRRNSSYYALTDDL